jgi:hypothetical protein
VSSKELLLFFSLKLNSSDQKLKEVRFHETLATHRNILKIIHAWEERERLYIQTELCHSK